MTTQTATQNLHQGILARPTGEDGWRTVKAVRVPDMGRWEVDFTDGTTEVTTRYAQWEVERS